MIIGIHTLVYSDDAPATRAFLRDVLGWPTVEMGESEPGWLIFQTGPSEMGVHPTKGVWEGQEFSSPLHHSISIMCDEIHSTVADLKVKGAEFEGEVVDYGFGLGIEMLLPGAGKIFVYEPRHPKAIDL